MIKKTYIFLAMIFLGLVFAPSAYHPAAAATDDFLQNGDFETGSLSPWTTDHAWVSSLITYKHTGSYGLCLAELIDIGPPPEWGKAYIQQSSLVIPVDDLPSSDAITFWMKAPSDQIKVTITYSDSGTDAFTFGTSFSWIERSIDDSELEAGHTITTIRIYRNTENSYAAIDDVQINELRPNIPSEGTVSYEPPDPYYIAVGQGSSGSEFHIEINHGSSPTVTVTYYTCYWETDSNADGGYTLVRVYMKVSLWVGTTTGGADDSHEDTLWSGTDLAPWNHDDTHTETAYDLESSDTGDIRVEVTTWIRVIHGGEYIDDLVVSEDYYF